MYGLLKGAYRGFHRGAIRTLNKLGFTVARAKDFYSPLPVLAELEETRELWDRPSELVGMDYDLEAMKATLAKIVGAWGAELAEQPSHEEIKKLGYGPGFPVIDALLVYCMIRELKPKRYIEIGSGLSTYYAWLAADRNRAEGSPCEMTCVDPFPTGKLWGLEGLSAIEKKVEEVDLALFDELGEGDVLFIDSTHVLKVGGDVAYLFLEVLPRLNPGVVYHVHDIHFPYNTPVPADEYIFGAKWPLFRTEAMILQALLSDNPTFETVVSAPMIRHFDEPFLERTIPGYRRVETRDYDTHFGSYWGRRVGTGR
jgi:predicted O-methyltransferase YrrM